MKNFSLIAFFVFCSFIASAQVWNVDKSHSSVSFEITHMMLSDVSGKFKVYDAKITSSKEDLSDAVFEFSADVASIDTDNERRDGHLQAEEYFNAADHPKITFKSTSFKKVSGGKYTMLGNLTMKGKTAPVTLAVTLKGPVTHPRNQKLMIGLKAIGELDRTTFGIGDSPAASLGHEVQIVVAGEFVKE
ncbi:YceI family protein [uncultured Arcticibacterium sp.]|uniref:YceI family protein n=1 Tax=uncultured Arcticibacterium sp. TaxID=2173042 RepID=UPI0030F8A83A